MAMSRLAAEEQLEVVQRERLALLQLVILYRGSVPRDAAKIAFIASSSNCRTPATFIFILLMSLQQFILEYVFRSQYFD